MQDLFETEDNNIPSVPDWQDPPVELIDAETLSLSSFARPSFIIEQMLTPGLAVLAGAPKLGKSWLVLDICQQVASGEELWGLKTSGGSVMYVALEDSKARLQDRLLSITDHPSDRLFLTTACPSLSDGLEDAVCYFKERHPDAKLVVIDTFQMIRPTRSEVSYAGDYAETSQLKQLADRLGICILLVHHTRKMADSDTVSEISGTNGIAGSADTLMVLKKPKRTENKATLYFTGRDILDRELTLTLDRVTCRWKHVSGDLPRQRGLPKEIDQLYAFMRSVGVFEGNNSNFAERFSAFCKTQVSSAVLKRTMNRYRCELEDRGVTFISLKTHKGRLLHVIYSEKYDKTCQVTDDGEEQASTAVTDVSEAQTAPAAPAEPNIQTPAAPPERNPSVTLPPKENISEKTAPTDSVSNYDQIQSYYAEYDECARDFDSYDGYIPGA